MDWAGSKYHLENEIHISFLYVLQKTTISLTKSGLRVYHLSLGNVISITEICLRKIRHLLSQITISCEIFTTFASSVMKRISCNSNLTVSWDTDMFKSAGLSTRWWKLSTLFYGKKQLIARRPKIKDFRGRTPGDRNSLWVNSFIWAPSICGILMNHKINAKVQPHFLSGLLALTDNIYFHKCW